jgi:SAM-dependent methyltransferase
MSEKIIQEVNKYYTNKVINHGATPQGVDWNGIESQENRFAQLLKITENETSDKYPLLDYGCGFGSLLSYLKRKNNNIDYIGYDISEEMIKKALEQHPNGATWLNKLELGMKADYVIASGLFNVKLEQSVTDWENYILTTLDEMNAIALKGFSFNILTSYSDKEYMRDYLYYASPEHYFKHCKLNYSRQVSLLHDYGLYEFTILVRK